MSNWLHPFQGRNYSGCYRQNFVWNDGRTYVMDNHRAALWCWLQQVSASEPFGLIHIDRHTDTLYSNIKDWLAVCPDVRLQSLDEYLSFSYKGTGADEYPLFRWDNYLSIFLEKFAANRGRAYFATHTVGDEPRGQNIQIVAPWDLPGNLSYWIESAKFPFVVNIDLDYFVYEYATEEYVEFFSDDFVEKVFQQVRSQMDAGRIAVLTICLSPECCGGWDRAEAFCKKVTGILGTDFKLP